MNRYRELVLLIAAASLTAACSTRQDFASREVIPSTTGVPATININTASIDEFEKLPRIGRKTAEAIVKFREENGPFRRPEYLLLIRGFSEKHFLEIRPLLRAD